MLLHGYIENGNINIIEKEILNELNDKYEIEIIVKDYKNINKNKKSAKGILEKYKNEKLIDSEKDIWNLVVSEKK
jgi:hypothetical protein